ncbi:Inositol polyphosphate 5-phosphatase [Entamoeba marina]
MQNREDNYQRGRQPHTPKFMTDREKMTEQVKLEMKRSRSGTEPNSEATRLGAGRSSLISSAHSSRSSTPKQFLLTRSKPSTLSDCNTFEEVFKPTTLPKQSFIPIVPRTWITSNKIPTREEIAKNPTLYYNLNLYAKDSAAWREKTILDQLPFYATAKSLKICACTWNINQGIYDQESVNQWTQFVSEDPDIIVVGVQELDMSIDAIITTKKYSEKAMQWLNIIRTSINRNGGEYVESGWYQLCGIVSFLFIKPNLKENISMYGIGVCKVGALSGKLANKGGVALGVKILDTTICFVNSHLAAHQEFLERRNKDWENISKIMVTYQLVEQEIALLEHDVVIWMGDLNYRIEMDDSQVRKLVNEKKKDQLFQCRMSGKVFPGFGEAHINFPPTFKIKIGSGEYKENRIPSWCDRVLYKTERRHGVEVKKYTSFELYNSDHKPSIMTRKKQVENFMEKQEKWLEMVAKPDISVTPKYLEFNNVSVLTKYTKEVTISNVGNTKAWLMCTDNVGKQVNHDWFTARLLCDEVEITGGNDVTKLKVEVFFDNHTAYLYQNKEVLAFKLQIDIRYSQVSIPILINIVTAESCVGMSLRSLVMLNRPLLGDHKHTYSSTYVFFTNTTTLDCAQDVIQALNYDKPFPKSVTVQQYMDILLVVLGGLKDSVFHDDFVEEIDLYYNDPELSYQYVMFMMEESHRTLYVYILKLIQKLAKRGANKDLLMNQFSKVLIRNRKGDVEIQQKCKEIMNWTMVKMG